MMRALLVLLAFTAVAHAQAPGEVQPAPSVMDNRWAVNVSLGGESLTAKTDGAQAVGFGVLDLAGRFRIRPSIEVALALALGGNQGISTGGIYVEGRYRFLAERPWSPFAGLALGIGFASDKTGTDTEKKGRGSLRISGGIERRIGNFGVEAAVRLIHIGENTKVTVTQTRGQELARYSDSGLELTLGGSYYF